MNAASITATLEDYLETIFNIVSRHKVARSKEIADSLNVKRPTVTVALRTLAEKGLINYEPRSYVTLTENGEKIAKCVDNRHNVLRNVFTEIFNLPADDSEKAACLMEHGMDIKLCNAMTNLLKAVRNDKELAKMLSEAMDRESKIVNCANICGDPQENVDQKDEKEIFDLNMLDNGQSGKIIRILGTGSLKKRLAEMGITSGQMVTVLKSAPLDDPIEIKVRNYNLAIRREDASAILIERK